MNSTNGSAKSGAVDGANGSTPSRRVSRLPTAPVPPLARRTGRVAEEARERARYEIARVLGDAKEERAAARNVAQMLASRDVEIDVAVEIALKALAQGDDRELRHALAGWLEGLGEPALAASELRKLVDESDPKTAAALLVRVGVLHARAGDAHGAEEALSRAARLDEADPAPLEMLGALAGWAPEVMSARGAAEAYVRAAKRRAAAGEPELELEDLLRAMELEPASSMAAAALATAHAVRSHGTAADEVLRAHAQALAAKGLVADAAEVHAQRRATALVAGDLSGALASALDEGLDAAFEGPQADAMDDLLARASAFDPLAVRLEVRAERAEGKAATKRWLDAGRLLEGPLAATERALEAYARAVAADATDADALASLRALATSSGSRTWLLEGLVRAIIGTEPASQLAAARALAEIADGPEEAPFAAWATTVVVELDPSDDRARSAAARLEEVTRHRDEEISVARRALDGGEDRKGALVRFVSLLRGMPRLSRAFATALQELAKLAPEDDAILSEAIRVADRVGDTEAALRLCRERLARPSPPPRVRIALVRALRRSGDLAAASEASRGLFDAVTPWAYSVAWIAAAQAGDKAARARALAALGPICSPKVVAVMTGAAAEELAREGDLAGARRAAAQASRVHDGDARALRILAEIVSPSEGRVAAAAIERAIAVAGPTSALSLRLADAYEQLGDVTKSVAWARRVVTLRPGDDGAVQGLVDRAARASDVGALAEALAWLVPQPRPARALAEAILPALRALAERDAKRAAEVCKKALDILGPRHASLRGAMEAIAQAAGNAALEAKIVERWIAAGAPAAERGALLLRLAKLYEAMGDASRELGTYARAARAGEDLTSVRERLAAFDVSSLTPDAEIALLEARAELHLDEGRTDLGPAEFRELGAALWDMAEDRPRAVQAWLRAAQLDSAIGYRTLRADLTAFGDAEYATDCLAELVDREGDDRRAAIIAVEAARAALDAGADARAMTLSRTSLERDPTRTEALQVAESSCVRVGRVQEMSPIYDIVARRALGRFGRRAAHHRAARFFESSGVHMMALKHAAQAFIAVPSEGSTLGLLARTADRAQRRSIAVRTLEHVAELARSPGQRAAWLLRAASMAGKDLEGARQRVDVLLKASVLSATPAILSMLQGAARDLLAESPDDAVALATRLERASDSLAKGLEGPDGARIALAFAEIGLELFRDAGWGWRAIEQATGADGDIEEYVRLVPHATLLSSAEGAAAALERVMASCEKPYANIGHSLLRLVAAIAAALGDLPVRARALVMAAEKEQDDDGLVAEAEDAVARLGDETLAARLTKKVDAERRSEALRTTAKKLVDDDAPASVRFLERAWLIAPAPAKQEISRELATALMKAGRGEEAIARDLEDPELEPVARADRLNELARMRRERDDKSGAAEALYEAAKLDPTFTRWTAAEESAEKGRREDLRVEALRALVGLSTGADRLNVMKRLARAEGARGGLDVAEAIWRDVWSVDPADNEPDVAIEALLVARSGHEELAGHLARRADRLAKDTAQVETLRAVRLRRAALLEQRLGRLEDAAKELEQLLVESPGHPSALRWLADLHERMGHAERALPALDELASKGGEGSEQGVEVRRVRALVASGEVDRAKDAASALQERAPEALEILEMRVEVARAAGDVKELGEALADLAKVSSEEARIRSEMLVEASQCAARAGDTDASLARARDAADLAPDAASTQLFARGLEYRLRGAGGPDAAEATIRSLGRLAPETLESEDVALRAFLLAEAEDVVSLGKGTQTLSECRAKFGPNPLVALGLAERAALADRAEEALRFYKEAFGGNLLGLRRAGFVAMGAADAAEACRDKESLLRFLDEAVKDDATRDEASERIGMLSLDPVEIRGASSVLRRIAENLEGEARADLLARVARAMFDSQDPAARIEADRTMRAAAKAAPDTRAAELQAELEAYRSRAPGPVAGTSLPPLPRAALPSVDPDEPIASVVHPLPEPVPPKRSVPPPVPQTAQAVQATLTSSIAPRPMDFVQARLASARDKLAAGDRDGAERHLGEALRGGSIEAADMLDELLRDDDRRTAHLTKIRRQAAELRPGDLRRLEALREAAVRDKNGNYQRAIEHVLRAFGAPEGPLAPPPLSAQNVQPGLLTLLSRHSREPAGEAFGIVWEGAQTLFAKPPTAYGTTGLERVVPGATSSLTRLYEIALRLLDVKRFSLYHRRGSGVLGASIPLLAQPSAILSGMAGEDSLELRWELGHALAGVIPQNVLPLAMVEAEGRSLWSVLVGAFGPPGRARLGREHAALAEMLWQTLSASAQRRLKELLQASDSVPYDLVVERAKQSGRRIGMFLTGDFGHAAHAVVRESRRFDQGVLDDGAFSQHGGLDQLCREIPALADLFRLAIRPEYADARWHVPAPQSQRFSVRGHRPV